MVPDKKIKSVLPPALPFPVFTQTGAIKNQGKDEMADTRSVSYADICKFLGNDIA